MGDTQPATEESAQTAPPSDPSPTVAEVVAALHPTQRPPTGGLAPPFSLPGYEFLAKLGEGGMGAVYLARQTGLGRYVAVKTIRPTPGGTVPGAGTARVRFEVEARATARAAHPNVIAAYDYGEADGVAYMVQEYAPGGSLDRRSAEWPLPWPDALRLATGIAAGLAHAHAAGIVHRDLKPANVLLDADGTPRVADFGLAKLLESDHGLTASGAFLGTVLYMSPEQSAGETKRLTPASDVWSVGVILFELLTGTRPFEGETPLEVIHRIQTLPPPPAPPGLPPWLARVLDRCLQKKADARYRDAGELLAALHAGPATERRTSPWAWAGAAAFFALIVGGTLELRRPAAAPFVTPPAGGEPVLSLGTTMVRIAPGTFRMGSDAGDGDERPVRDVTISRAFRIGRTEVTVRQYRLFLAETRRDGGPAWAGPPDPNRADYPASDVSWDDATAFCDWLARKEGRPYRLPTEAEWEYACRAGTRTPWNWGDSDADAHRRANCAGAADGYAHSSPVATFPPNAWGLCDTHGNLWEWCADAKGPYPDYPETDPNRRVGDDGLRIYRGGSWNRPAERCRSSVRYANAPSERAGDIGFRVAFTE